MSCLSSLSSDDVELSQERRIELAHARWLEAKVVNELLSITKVAKRYGVSKSTLVDRINKKTKPAAVYHLESQRLTPEEETAILNWILRLQAWGWPPLVAQTRYMANELLLKKGDRKPIGINWPQKFMKRHPSIKSAYIPPLDKERAIAQDPTILQDWFQLYLRVRSEYEVQDCDIYNMDEKGFMMGVIAKLRVMISKHEKKAYMTQPGNREWVSLLECVSLTGKSLPLWMIFKGKQLMKAWREALADPHGEIAVSDNGWTDNIIGLAWIKRCLMQRLELINKENIACS